MTLGPSTNMTTPDKLNEFNHAEDPARRLLERLGWTYVPADTLASERPHERDVLLKDRLRAALLRLNDGLTGAQAERVIFDLERAEGIGMARNRLVHEYLTYGMPLTVDGPNGRDTRTIRFFDFDDPVGGLNEFVVTTQFRVLRGNEKGDLNDDRRVVIPDLVLFVNGIPLVVMEAKSPTLMDVWKTQAVRPTAALPGSRAPMGRRRRAGVVPLQPAVHRPQRGRRRVLVAVRPGERVLRVEIGAPVHGAGRARPVRRWSLTVRLNSSSACCRRRRCWTFCGTTWSMNWTTAS